MSKKALDHWVVIPDEDLAYILDGPDAGDEADWIAAVIGIIEDGLETW